jgi:hypothetical protein
MPLCGCSYGYEDADDGEPCSVWREKRITATRKAHRCCECGATIPVGSHCCYAFGVYDGSATTYYRCPTCAALAELLAMMNQECPLWGGLEESCDYTDGVDWREWHDKAHKEAEA